MEHNVILNIVIAPCRNTILYEMPHYEASNQLLHYDLVIKTDIKNYYEMIYYDIRNEIQLVTMP